MPKSRKSQRKTRRSQKSQKSQNQRTRKQRGGSPNYGYTGQTIATGSGAPLEAWSSSDAHCGWTSRGQLGGSSGNGGYAMVLSNQNGKMFDGIVRGACPSQRGGDPKQLIQSYPSGYSLGSPYNSSSSNFLEPTRYGRHCMGGGYTKKNRRRRHH